MNRYLSLPVMKTKIYTGKQALEKCMQLCAKQERCHSEIRNKLFKWGIYKDDAEAIIAKLIEEGFLNETRFAKSFTRGKFRMKKWGKKKIVRELRKHNISSSCIQAGMLEIEDDDYINTLKSLIYRRLKKYISANKKEKLKHIRSTYRYLVQKGYETTLVSEYLKEF